MTAQHPIYDHLKRDADQKANKPPAQPPAQSAQPPQTPRPVQPIPTRRGPIRSALRRLMITKTAHRNTTPAATTPPRADKASRRLIHAARRRWLSSPSRHLIDLPVGQADSGHLADILTATPGEPKLPNEIFPRLHWGGQLLYAGENEKSVRNLAEAYHHKSGFDLEQPVTAIYPSAMGMRIPGRRPRGYAFLARKTRLIQPGDFTERFTYHVELSRCPPGPNAPDGYVVTKRVPTYHDLLNRLRNKFPDTDLDDLRKRAHKLVEQVFPTFLTREAAMLGILQKNLEPRFRDRVPKPLGIEKDKRGFVRTLHMKWMRVGGEPIGQLDFAIQAAELLAALHEQARVMHLDLRLDNMVITPGGVGFVDFGSACRIGEEINRSPMLGSLFTEMMRTSQIQRMLGKMIERGHVTNSAIAEVYGKVDKTVDAFYLAVQIAKPHGNPDLRQYIQYDPESDLAKTLSALTAAVLRPKNPEMAQYKSARDLVRGLRRIQSRLKR